MASAIFSCMQQLQKSVECPICLDKLTDPIETKCSHTFCSKCLYRMLEGNTTIPCPLCKFPLRKRNTRKAAFLGKVIDMLSVLNQAYVSDTKLAEKRGSTNLVDDSSVANVCDKFVQDDPELEVAANANEAEKGNKLTRTPDLLDIVDKLYTTDTNDERADGGNLEKVSELAAGSRATVTQTEMSAAPEDPFAFPISQNQPKLSKKRRVSKAGNKTAQSGLVDNGSVSKPKKTKKAARVKRCSRKLVHDKTDVDQQVISMITEAEGHKLTVETTDTSPTTSSSSKTKPEQRELDNGNMIAEDEGAVQTQHKPNTRKRGNKSQMPDPLHDSTEPNLAPEIATPEPTNTDNTKTPSAGKQKDKRRTLISTKKKDDKTHPIRLLHSESSSSLTEASTSRSKVTEAKQQDFNDKVSSWLENVDPLVSHSDHDDKTHSDFDKVQERDSDFEDLVSASQVVSSPNQTIMRKPRRFLPKVDLSKLQQQNAIRNAEVFGESKLKQQYAPKNNVTENCVYDKKMSPKAQETTRTPTKTTKKSKRRKSKSSKEKHIFDLNGLSQGVSPFTTPTKEGKDANNNSSYKDVDTLESHQLNEALNELNDVSTARTDARTGASNARQANEVHELGIKHVDDHVNDVSKKPCDLTSPANHSHENGLELDHGSGLIRNNITSGNIISYPCANTLEEGNPTAQYPNAVHLGQQLSKPSGNHIVVSHHSDNCHVQDQNSQSTPGIVDPKETTVTAIVYPQPNPNEKSKRNGNFKTPDNIPSAKTTPRTLTKFITDHPDGAVRLEDMPIICVRETQDGSNSNHPYYVETPDNTQMPTQVQNSNVLENCEVKCVENNIQTSRKPVELGIFDFSQPSQSQLNKQSQFHDEATCANDASDAKIMQTCRMVMSNFGDNVVADKDPENINTPEQVEKSGVSSTITPDKESHSLLDSGVRNELCIGRSVDLARSRRKIIKDTTMEEVHATLSQIENEKKEEGQQIDGHDDVGALNESKSTFSVYTCATPRSEMSNTSFNENVVQNTEDSIAIPASSVNKSRTGNKKPGSLRKQAPKSTTGHKSKTPKIKILSSHRTRSSRKSQSPKKKETPQKSKKIPATKTPNKSIVEEPEVNCHPDDGTEMVCTSNGWGGTKLKIRILRHSCSGSDNELRETKQDSVVSPVKLPSNRSPVKLSNNEHDSNETRSINVKKNHQASDSSLMSQKSKRALKENSQKRTRTAEHVEDEPKIINPETISDEISNQSAIVVCDSLQSSDTQNQKNFQANRRTPLKIRRPSSQQNTTSKKRLIMKEQRRDDLDVVYHGEKTNNIFSASVLKAGQQSASTWPKTSTQKRTSSEADALASCGIMQNVSVVLDKMDDTMLSGYADLQSSVNRSTVVTPTSDAVAEMIQDIIPNSPLLFACSQVNSDSEDEKINLSNNAIVQSQTMGVAVTSKVSAMDDNDVICCSWHEPTKDDNSCHHEINDNTVGDVQPKDAETPSIFADKPQEVEAVNFSNKMLVNENAYEELLQHVQAMQNICINLNSDCRPISMKLSELERAIYDSPLHPLSQVSQSQPSVIKCTSRRTHRVLSSSSEDEEPTFLPLSKDSCNSNTINHAIENSNEIDSSLPSLNSFLKRSTNNTSKKSDSSPKATYREDSAEDKMDSNHLLQDRVSSGRKKSPQSKNTSKSLTLPPSGGEKSAPVNDVATFSRVSSDSGMIVSSHKPSSKRKRILSSDDDCGDTTPKMQKQSNDSHFGSSNLTQLPSKKSDLGKTSIPADAQPSSNIVADSLQMHDDDNDAFIDNSDNIQHEIFMEQLDKNTEKIAESQDSGKELIEIRDSPMSPSNNDTSENEIVENNDQHDKPADCETPPLTESQVPPLTPPPFQPQFSMTNDTSDVDCLLRKITELTADCEDGHADSDAGRSAGEVVAPSVPSVAPVSDVNMHHEVEETRQEEQLETLENLPVRAETTPRRPEIEQFRSPLSSNQCIINQDSAKLDEPRKQYMDKLTRSVASTPSLSVSSMSISDSSIHNNGRRLGVMTSGLRGRALGLVKDFTKKFGGIFYETFVAGKVTHVIVRTEQMRCDRTLKYLQAVAGKLWLVRVTWVQHCLKKRMLLPEDRYEVIGDNLEEEASYGPKRSRECDPEFKLLSEYVVHCIPPFALFTEEQFIELIEMCGAKVVPHARDLTKYDEKRIITVDPEAFPGTLPNYRELSVRYNADAVSCAWVLDCVATFNVQPTSNFPLDDFDSEII